MYIIYSIFSDNLHYIIIFNYCILLKFKASLKYNFNTIYVINNNIPNGLYRLYI